MVNLISALILLFTLYLNQTGFYLLPDGTLMRVSYVDAQGGCEVEIASLSSGGSDTVFVAQGQSQPETFWNPRLDCVGPWLLALTEEKSAARLVYLPLVE